MHFVNFIKAVQAAASAEHSLAATALPFKYSIFDPGFGFK